MSASFGQDYIGLSSGTSSAERSPDKISTASSTSSSHYSEEEKNINALNLKETELRLGLPGSEFPERKAGPPSGVALFGKSCVSGAKRGFSDAIDGSGKWDLSINGGSGVGFGKDGILFSQVRGGRGRGGDGGKNIHTLHSCLPWIAAKEVIGEAAATEEKNCTSSSTKHGNAPASKAQVVGWPPIRSFRKNSLATYSSKERDSEASKSGPSCLYVKVSMDGAPYLRKADLKTYSNYSELSSALKMLFSCFTIGECPADELLVQEGLKERGLVDILHDSEHVLTYEDKDGDWMLVGDVPWEMFICSCKRLRIMRGPKAITKVERKKKHAETGFNHFS